MTSWSNLNLNDIEIVDVTSIPSEESVGIPSLSTSAKPPAPISIPLKVTVSGKNKRHWRITKDVVLRMASVESQESVDAPSLSIPEKTITCTQSVESQEFVGYPKLVTAKPKKKKKTPRVELVAILPGRIAQPEPEIVEPPPTLSIAFESVESCELVGTPILIKYRRGLQPLMPASPLSASRALSSIKRRAA